MWLQDRHRVQPDMPGPMVTTAPACLHPLQVIAVHVHAQPWLPSGDQLPHRLVHHLGAFFFAGARPHRQFDAAMAQPDHRFRPGVANREQITPGLPSSSAGTPTQLGIHVGAGSPSSASFFVKRGTAATLRNLRIFSRHPLDTPARLAQFVIISDGAPPSCP